MVHGRFLEPARQRKRRLWCMSGLTATLPFPATTGGTTTLPRKLDHRTNDEAALVRRVQAQDEMAFREVVDRYQAKVFSIIYGILRNRNDAEDIAQQVLRRSISRSRTSISVVHCLHGSTRSP